MKPPAKKFQRKQSAASAMFHEVSDRTRSSTGHSTLPAHMSESLDAEEAARRSSIAVLRLDKGYAFGDDVTVSTMQSGERPSWWAKPEGDANGEGPASCGQRIRIVFDTLVLIGIGVGLFLAAYFTQNRALPFIMAVAAALATYESTWLAYRLRLRLFLPFQLHQKQTCRDIYSQIMNYSVDLQTCAITPLAERFLRGRKLLAAALTAILCGGIALLITWFVVPHKTLVAYISLTTFLGVWCAALSPNLRDASVLAIRYSYFTLSSASLLILSPPTASSITPNAVLEPFHLMVLTAFLILISRALTSKDPMETIVMALLDIVGLIYLACLANVINYLAAFTSAPSIEFEADADALQSRHTIVFAVFIIIWSAEVGSFLMEKLLREAQFPWTHPLSSRLSSRQNLEKLTGALLFGIAANFLVTDWMLPRDVLPISNVLMMATSIAAIVVSHICKLWLISLKKVAKVSATGRYLRIGDGVIDRVDSLLISTIVFVVALRRVLV